MNKTDKLLESLNVFIQKAEENQYKQLGEMVPDFPGKSNIPNMWRNMKKALPDCSDASIRSF